MLFEFFRLRRKQRRRSVSRIKCCSSYCRQLHEITNLEFLCGVNFSSSVHRHFASGLSEPMKKNISFICFYSTFLSLRSLSASHDHSCYVFEENPFKLCASRMGFAHGRSSSTPFCSFCSLDGAVHQLTSR